MLSPRWLLYTQASAAIAWGALALQLYLVLWVRWQEQASLVGGLVHFFSYFTILTNTAVATTLSCALSRRRSLLCDFFRQPVTVAGVATSIAVVGIAYSLLLRDVWQPQGLQWLANECLHDILPVVFGVYWWACVPKGYLRAWHVLAWAVYPFAYFLWIMLRGQVIGVYPYPFVDVDALGWGQVLINACAILLGFAAVASAFVLLDRRLARAAKA
ncbi:Pr6Pr family membrane protein [Pseudomonas sp. nanlin1]